MAIRRNVWSGVQVMALVAALPIGAARADDVQSDDQLVTRIECRAFEGALTTTETTFAFTFKRAHRPGEALRLIDVASPAGWLQAFGAVYAQAYARPADLESTSAPSGSRSASQLPLDTQGTSAGPSLDHEAASTTTRVSRDRELVDPFEIFDPKRIVDPF